MAPLVADLFGDQDTRVIAAANEVVPGTLAHGPSAGPLFAALERLAAGRNIAGLVTGSGFEHRPHLLDKLSQRYRLLGNAGTAVRRLKDPFAFAEICRQLGIPHPEIHRAIAPLPGWLIKRAGAAGGTHIRAVREGERLRRREYSQQLRAGEPISALFLANGTHNLTLGFSRQWPDPTPDRPFRFGGAARPVAPACAARMLQAIVAIVQEVGLLGLNSADFLVRENEFDLLEINPRPGATLDIYRHPSLFRLHVAACAGELPSQAPIFAGAAACAVVYAQRTFELTAGFPWPDWVADRQAPGPVVQDAPFCTVVAEAEEITMSQELVARRKAEVLALAGDRARRTTPVRVNHSLKQH
jgi:predicted ATP-grasp superfamily ATP-dependent carboligase